LSANNRAIGVRGPPHKSTLLTVKFFGGGGAGPRPWRGRDRDAWAGALLRSRRLAWSGRRVTGAPRQEAVLKCPDQALELAHALAQGRVLGLELGKRGARRLGARLPPLGDAAPRGADTLRAAACQGAAADRAQTVVWRRTYGTGRDFGAGPRGRLLPGPARTLENRSEVAHGFQLCHACNGPEGDTKRVSVPSGTPQSLHCPGPRYSCQTT
jgi:hypothetical protein